MFIFVHHNMVEKRKQR